jgi:hypothetical protein
LDTHVSDIWLAIVVVGTATVVLKATGPVLLGGRELPPRVNALVVLLAPAVLAALVVTQVVGGDRELVFDRPAGSARPRRRRRRRRDCDRPRAHLETPLTG